MNFTAAGATDRYQPRATDAPAALFKSRVTVCEKCPLRRAHSCRMTDRLVSIMARPADANCPNRSWPGDPLEPAAGKVTEPAPRNAKFLPAAIIIPCHNYGRFLAEAIASALTQTVRPAAVVVVDDSSTDETPAVAGRFADRKVRLVHVQAGNVHAAQRAGFEVTTEPIVCFLDADDVLPPDYLEQGLPQFADNRVAVVYSDMEHFGDAGGTVNFPPPSAGIPLEQQNRCHSASLLRRAAAESAGIFDRQVTLAPYQLQDWFAARRIVANGWRLAKSSAAKRNRRHAESWLARVNQRPGDPRASYFHQAALDQETITLFIPFSGRQWAWPATRDFLERQTWPHSQTRLVFCDTSASAAFGKQLRHWLAASDYADARYYRQAVTKPGAADENRGDKSIGRIVDATMPRIYNPMIQDAGTEYVWILEDDIVPPADVAERLLRSFAADVASVAATYRSRFHRDQLIVFDRAGKFFKHPAPPRVEAVGGNGFGCTILRRSVLRDTVLYHDHVTGRTWYDVNFYRDLAAAGRYRALADFRILCDHLAPKKEPAPAAKKRPPAKGPGRSRARPRVKR